MKVMRAPTKPFREREYVGGILDYDTKNKYLRVGLETPSNRLYLTQPPERTSSKTHPGHESSSTKVMRSMMRIGYYTCITMTSPEIQY